MINGKDARRQALALSKKAKATIDNYVTDIELVYELSNEMINLKEYSSKQADILFDEEDSDNPPTDGIFDSWRFEKAATLLRKWIEKIDDHIEYIEEDARVKQDSENDKWLTSDEN